MFVSRSASRGFSLVEALVALVVGLVTVVVIMQALGNAETQRRAISGGGDANTAGTIALQLIQRDLMNAGFGMAAPVDGVANSDLYSVCGAVPVVAYNTQRAQGDGTLATQTINLPARAMVPVTRYDSRPAGVGITSPTPAYLTAPDPADPANPTGFDADTDILQITYSGSSTFIGSGVAVQNQTAATTPYSIVVDPGRLTNVSLRNGIHQGDLVIVGDSPPGTTLPRNPCVVAQVTHIPTTIAAATSDECGVATANVGDSTIWHNAGGFNNWHLGTPPACAPDVARWNNPGAPNLGVTLGGNPRLFSLGAADRFAIRAYGIRNGRLTVCNPLLQDCTDSGSWLTIADGIVSLRVMLGVDDRNVPAGTTVADGIVTPPTYAANGTLTALNEWARNLPANIFGTVPTPAAIISWTQFRSVHVALVARSTNLQRDPIQNATCQPDWTGFPHDNTVAPATRTCTGTADNAGGEFWLASGFDGANWARYQTRVFETTVPIRSLFWSNN